MIAADEYGNLTNCELNMRSDKTIINSNKFMQPIMCFIVIITLLCLINDVTRRSERGLQSAGRASRFISDLCPDSRQCKRQVKVFVIILSVLM